MTGRSADGSPPGPAKVLCLMRHAKSSWDDPELCDFDRPLSPRGEKAASRMAAYLHGSTIRPDLIVCSAARRARQTAAALSRVYPEVEVVTEAGLYGATVVEMMERVRILPEGRDQVIIVGHNPGMHELAVTMAGYGDRSALRELADAFPTGAVAMLASAGAWSEFAPGTARLVWFAAPRRLAPGRFE